MRIGVVYPQIEFGTDVERIREFATLAESLGYDHIVAYDHVLGANRASRPDWQGPYHSEHVFFEPFVLFSYMAAITQRIEFTTGIIILPQRQTALVAKQAACIDHLSGGRLRLGIGTGWNQVEYDALGEDFGNRGKRSEEQIELMRALWSGHAISFEGRWHRVEDAGINPLPVNGTIPIWFGGMAPQVMERVGRMGDGWYPMARPGLDMPALLEQVRAHARAAGRDPAALGFEIGMAASDDTAKNLERLQRLEEWGATHVTINTMNQGFTSPDQHLDRIKLAREAVDKLYP